MGRAWHVIWPNKKNLYFSKIVVLSSTLAAGIVQDSLLEKLEKASTGDEVETTGVYFCHRRSVILKLLPEKNPASQATFQF